MAETRIYSLRDFLEAYRGTSHDAFRLKFPHPLLVHEAVAGTDPSGSTMVASRVSDAAPPGTGDASPVDIGQVIPLGDADGPIARVRLGRSREADVSLRFERVSRIHAIVAFDAVTGRFIVTDGGSTNGTRVNGRALGDQERCDLSDGDGIDLGGGLQLTFLSPEGLHRVLPVLAKRVGGLGEAPGS